MDEETLGIFRSLAERRSSLATSEMKNMVSGDREVTLAIPKLSNAPMFDWISCTK